VREGDVGALLTRMLVYFVPKTELLVSRGGDSPLTPQPGSPRAALCPRGYL
jgi:hypothetical protein